MATYFRELGAPFPLFEAPIPGLSNASLQFVVGLRDGAAPSVQWRFAIGLWAPRTYRYFGDEH